MMLRTCAALVLLALAGPIGTSSGQSPDDLRRFVALWAGD